MNVVLCRGKSVYTMYNPLYGTLNSQYLEVLKDIYGAEVIKYVIGLGLNWVDMWTMYAL